MYFAVSERFVVAAMAANGNVDKWVEISQQCKVDRAEHLLYFMHHNLEYSLTPNITFLSSIFRNQSSSSSVTWSVICFWKSQMFNLVALFGMISHCYTYHLILKITLISVQYLPR